MRRGEIYYAHLGATVGQEQAGLRPVVVVQAENISTLTIVVVPFTTNLKSAGKAGRILICAREGGLTKDSIALCHQIRVLSIHRLKNFLGTISDKKMAEIDIGIRDVLGLD